MSNWDAIFLSVWRAPFLNDSNVADVNFFPEKQPLSITFLSLLYNTISVIFFGKDKLKPLKQFLNTHLALKRL